MSLVNQFLNAVFHGPLPEPPEITHREMRQRRKARQQVEMDKRWRSGFCEDVLAILNDPAHNKTTE